MNLLPPRPRSERYFYLWLALILFFFSAGVAGTLVVKEKLKKKVELLESEVHLKRRSLYEARKKEKEEKEFMKKHGPVLDYRDTVGKVEEGRINWREITENLEQGMPARTELIQWKAVGNEIMGWGRFDSSRTAVEYVKKHALNNPHLFNQGWVDCLGEACLAENAAKTESAQGVLVQFRFEIRKPKKESQKGGESPLDDRLPENDGNPGPLYGL